VTEQGALVPLIHDFPKDLVSRYATHFVVQHTEQEFVISFFEVDNPILLGTPEENREALRSMSGVPAHCVARIIIAPNRMEQFVQILQQNLERFHAMEENKTDDDE